MPVYAETTRTNIKFSTSWDDHTEHIAVADTDRTIPAAFPVDWFEPELKKHLATTGPSTQYERWGEIFPGIAQDFVEVAEEMPTTPQNKAKLLLDTLFPTMDQSVMASYFDREKIPCSEAVCGNCHWSQQDEYQETEVALVCWRNQPNGSGNQPQKISRTDEFAQDCPNFSFEPYIDENMAKSMDLHERLQRPSLLKKLVGTQCTSKREQRKAALKFAYYRTWGSEDWNKFNFLPAGEEGFLRGLNSDQAVLHDDGCATRSETKYPPREVDPDNQAGLAEFL